ncbi:hypothetical protein [Robertmurraya massiliosenegalensis]|uniref:hypothetical protein n=1 Tax=Robertmurraya massiliosenegalensis TaxID=1287657 RepID=UPI000310E7C5|nr:hypothetical protein [Robertmurraya massiliosenegalensis]
MVLLKKTEIKSKNEGFADGKQAYETKINLQKAIFNHKVHQFEENISKKEKLIIDLELMLSELKDNTFTSNNNAEIHSYLINTLERCVNVMNKDIETTSSVNADKLLIDKRVPRLE